MSAIATSAPARASVSASARPSPREPPVTSATRPERSISSAIARDPMRRRLVEGAGATDRAVEERRARLVRRHLLTPAARVALGRSRSADALVRAALDRRRDGVPLGARAVERRRPGRHRARALRGSHGRAHARHAPDALRRAAGARGRSSQPACTDDDGRARAAPGSRAGSPRPGGIDDAGAWLADARGDRAGGSRGRAARRRRRRSSATSPLLATKIQVGAGTWDDPAERRLAGPPAARDGRDARSRPATRHLEQRPVPLGPDRRPGSARSEPLPTVADARAELVRRWLARLRPGDRDRPALVDGLDGPAIRAALAAVRCRRGRPRRGARASCSPTISSAIEPPGAVGRAAARRSITTTMGWKERDWYLGAHGPTLFDRNGNAGPTVWWDGRVVGGWSQRRDGEIVYRLLEDVGSEAERAVAAGGGAHRGLDGRSADQPRLPAAVPARAGRSERSE